MMMKGPIINPHLVRKALEDAKLPKSKFVGEKDRSLKSQKLKSETDPEKRQETHEEKITELDKKR